jgi:OFA family oxalate/formate antiporter-like MFS transporter
MQWFPDKKGLITGVAVAGFGLGAVIWVKLAGTWGGLIADWGLGRTFVFYAVVFFAVVMAGSFWMRFPPSATSSTAHQTPTRFDFRSAEMIRTRHYWSIFVTFAFSTAAGLMCIGLMKQFPAQALHEGGMPPAAADAAAGMAVVVFAIFNAIGRIGWGRISDRIGHAVNCDHRGRRTALIAMAANQAVCVALFPFFAGTEQSLYLLAALIGFNFGGNFALFPAITSDTFGHRFFGHNYGLVFIAYGIGGGAMGPMLGGYLGDLGHFTLAFLLAATMSLVAAIVISSVRIPTRERRPVSSHDGAIPGAATGAAATR